jgi:hypothetical protein
MKNANNPAYLDPSKPPFPAQNGWKWLWCQPKPGKWSARRILPRKYERSLTPRLMHYAFNHSIVSRIIDCIFPCVYPWDYPGRRECLEKIVGRRITRPSLCYWRKHDRLPSEVRDRLAEWMEADIRRRTEALAALKALLGAKPRVNGGRAPHKRRAERLAAEDAARDRELNGPIPKPNVPPPPPKSACRAWVEARLRPPDIPDFRD